MIYVATWSDPVDGEFRRHSGNASDLAGILRDLAADIDEKQIAEVEASIMLSFDSTPINIKIESHA